MLREIENLVAEAVEVNVPFMNPITYVYFLPASEPTISYFLQGILCIHAQGRYSCQGNPQQPEHL